MLCIATRNVKYREKVGPEIKQPCAQSPTLRLLGEWQVNLGRSLNFSEPTSSPEKQTCYEDLKRYYANIPGTQNMLNMHLFTFLPFSDKLGVICSCPSKYSINCKT